MQQPVHQRPKGWPVNISLMISIFVSFLTIWDNSPNITQKQGFGFARRIKRLRYARFVVEIVEELDLNKLSSACSGRGFRQFLLRGFDSVQGEWSLVCIGWNIRRMHALKG